VTYVLTCVSGARTAAAQVTVIWSVQTPAVTLSALLPVPAYVGNSYALAWSSNQSSCSASGGSSGDGWTGSALSSSGQLQVNESVPGTYNYTITCVTGSQTVSQSVSATYSAPTAAIKLYTPTGLRFGQAIILEWNSSNACTASGGGSGDSWGGSVASNGFFSLSEQTAGTYTYTISCGPAGAAAVAQVSYTFNNAAPTATLTATQSSQVINLLQQTYPTLLSWSSNVEACEVA
jgi:hypothetical protein